MGDNAPMTDRSTDPEALETDLVDLDSADPADAPQIAEDVADRLAEELDDARRRASRPGDAS